MNIRWYTKNHNASGCIHNIYLILFFNLRCYFWIIKIMIYWCCNYICKLYCMWTWWLFFFYIWSRDNWVTLFYSLLFRWDLLGCMIIKKSRESTEKNLNLSDKPSTKWSKKKTIQWHFAAIFLFSESVSANSGSNSPVTVFVSSSCSTLAEVKQQVVYIVPESDHCEIWMVCRWYKSVPLNTWGADV